MGSTKIIMAMAVAILVVMGGSTEAAITCFQVLKYVSPCVPYVQNGGAVPPECCAGIKALKAAARTTGDRQSGCRCFKSAINGIPYTGANAALAAGLPSKCSVKSPYKISPSTDCARVK